MQSVYIKIEQEDDQGDWKVMNEGRRVRDETSDDTENSILIEVGKRWRILNQ